MKLGGMSQAFNGHCLDTSIMLAAMTEGEKLKLVAEIAASIKRWNNLMDLTAEPNKENDQWPD